MVGSPGSNNILADLIEIRLSPYFNAYYYSYYIFGFRAILAGTSIRFGWLRRKEIPVAWQNTPHIFAILRFRRAMEALVGIDCYDKYRISPELLSTVNWYFKVNYDPTTVDRLPLYDARRVIPIGPNFGITGLGMLSSLNIFLRGVPFTGLKPKAVREYFAGFYRQIRYRRPLAYYQVASDEPGSVFFCGTYWPEAPAINPQRARIMEVCRQIFGTDFEGGFAPRPEARETFPHLVMPHWYPPHEYFEKLRRSPMAFCTPGVHECLGWKLGECLAMSKATICLPLRRKMPAPLVHGTHVHFVNEDLSDLEEAVRLLHDDVEYRMSLETGARQYFQKYLHPVAVCRRIIQSSGSTDSLRLAF